MAIGHPHALKLVDKPMHTDGAVISSSRNSMHSSNERVITVNVSGTMNAVIVCRM